MIPLRVTCAQVTAALFVVAGLCSLDALAPPALAEGPARVVLGKARLEIDPSAGLVRGWIEIERAATGELEFELDPQVRVRVTDASGADRAGVVLERTGDRVHATGKLRGSRLAWTVDPEALAGGGSSDRFVTLPHSAAWYPRLGSFELKVDLPASWTLFAEPAARGTKISVDAKRSAGIVAGAYKAMPIRGAPFELSVYRFEDTSNKQAQRWQLAGLRAFESWLPRLGAFAYERLSIVESESRSARAHEGIGSVVLVPQETFRQAPIDARFLDEAIISQWLGHSTRAESRADRQALAGLRAYLIHRHGYEDKTAEDAVAERRHWLRQHAAAPGSFEGGRGRAAMTFHMLERHVGRETFDAALVQFVAAHGGRSGGWPGLRGAFSRAVRQDMTAMFDAWTARDGVPRIELEAARSRTRLDDSYVDVLIGCEPACLGRIPLRIKGQGSEAIEGSVRIKGPKGSQRFEVPFVPLTVQLDPYADVMRQLGSLELPPTLSRAHRDEVDLVILGTARDRSIQNAARTIAPLVTNKHVTVRFDHQVTRETVASATRFWLIGLPEETFYERLNLPMPPTVFSTQDSLTVDGATAYGSAALLAAFRDAYSGYDYVLFDALTPSAMLQISHRIDEHADSARVLVSDGQVRIDSQGDVSTEALSKPVERLEERARP